MLLRWLCALVCLCFAVACNAAPSGPAAAPAAVPAAARADQAAAAPTGLPPAARQLEVPMGTVSATNTPLWVAVEQGLFLKHGLEVSLTAASAAAATQAVQTETVPFAATTANAVTAYANGARNLTIVAGLLNKVLFQLVAQPDIATVQELRGRPVGASAAGSTAAIALGATLQRGGLDPGRDVTVVNLRDQPSILASLLNGQVAAGMISSPYNKQALGQGYRLLFDTATSDIEILGLHITTTRGLLEREPELVRRFVMGHVEGIQQTRQQPSLAVESMLRGTRSDDRAAAEEAYGLYRAVWDAWPSVPALRTLLENLDDVPGVKDLRAEEIIDASVLRELEASGWLGQNLTPLAPATLP